MYLRTTKCLYYFLCENHYKIISMPYFLIGLMKILFNVNIKFKLFMTFGKRRFCNQLKPIYILLHLSVHLNILITMFYNEHKSFTISTQQNKIAISSRSVNIKARESVLRPLNHHQTY